MLKAMILAAGLGTRLLPLTSKQPKALVEVAGKPLIEHVLDRFRQCGIREFIINLHHHSGQLQEFLGSEKFKEFSITFSDESGQSHTSRPLAFSGIYVLDPAIFSFMPDADAFSIIDVLVTAAVKMPVVSFEHSPDIWVDAGNFNNLGKAEQLLKNFHL